MTEYRSWAENVKTRIIKKMEYVSRRNEGKIPYTTNAEGIYDDKSDESVEFSADNGLKWWTNGFWGGIMWMLYQATNEERYITNAKDCLNKLNKTFDIFEGLHHDVGFMFMPTAVAECRITGDERSRTIALHAANILAGRFNINGRYIRAWNDLPDVDTRGWAIIDCMFNITLLYWASEETGDPRYREIAMAHADTVMKYFIRDNGSSIHIGEFNPDTGEYIRNYAGQGYSIQSAWTRGQGWALYGFCLSYLHTGKKEYLETACHVADYCLEQISDNYVIPIDFMQPDMPQVEDSCGACVIAGGLIELSKVAENGHSDIYLETAINILKTLDKRVNDYSTSTDAIVNRCSAAYYSKDHDMTMNYADYYFIEAIWKLTDTGANMW